MRRQLYSVNASFCLETANEPVQIKNKYIYIYCCLKSPSSKTWTRRPLPARGWLRGAGRRPPAPSRGSPWRQRRGQVPAPALVSRQLPSPRCGTYQVPRGGRIERCRAPSAGSRLALRAVEEGVKPPAPLFRRCREVFSFFLALPPAAPLLCGKGEWCSPPRWPPPWRRRLLKMSMLLLKINRK